MENNNQKNEALGFAGKLGQTFVHSKLTPVIAVVSILLGLMAVYLTPKEEEPQISVPMIDIRTGAPGLTAEETERKVTEPIERAVWGLDGVEYVYSASQAHGSLVTVRFKVGEPIEPSLVKIHHKLMSIRNELPQQAMQPQVKSFSIDDVPFLVLTFTSKNKNDFELRSAVAPLARELSSTPDLARVELLGGLKRNIRVIADPVQMKNHGISIFALAQALKANDSLMPSGKTWGSREVFDIEVGGRLESVEQIKKLPIGQRAGQVVRIENVAKVTDGPEERVRSSVLLQKDQAPQDAVSIVFAKRKGTNVVVLSKQLLERAETFLKGKDVEMHIVRDYGSTAEDKSNELIEHLLLATLSVSVLIALFMGIRASLVVAIAIPVTLALTLAIYYFMGYTLNRVTLFALIFSIGILVDDAIVVVENIERHLNDNKNEGIVKATIRAVSEVGNPTILATFTVIAAILPMAFVRGLMGPYMKPIPVGASFAMILSLFVAFIVTPWAAVKLLKPHSPKNETSEQKVSKLDLIYQKIMETLLNSSKSAWSFGGFTILLLVLAASLVATKSVKVKMLPFDNKEEFQVLIDYPTPTELIQSRKWSQELAEKLLQHSEVETVQVFAGEPSPYSFSGMVKHTFLRESDYQNDLQIVLTSKNKRKLSSHQVIEQLRPIIAEFSKQKSAVTKVLEIPPGPPVMSTLLAEVYGPDRNTRTQVTQELYKLFAQEPSVVDLDTSLRPGRERKLISYDYTKAGVAGTKAKELAMLANMAYSESIVGTLADVKAPEEMGIALSLENTIRGTDKALNGLMVPSFESGTIDASQVIQAPRVINTEVLHRKNLKPVSYVMAELSGAEEAPVYGIMKLAPQIKYPLQTADVPWNTTEPVVKWDGEWFITYEVFRDLGAAFAVVMVLIYVLVLGWFRSFTVPLVIMAPIPISLIGILPGHAMMGSYFTATSMIGFIAGAGIIVRNSIILVDFIEHQMSQGHALKEAVISAGVLRFRPMLLTAAAVVVGSSVMLMDPIFQGLAVSLIFGEVAATLISRFAVPVMYFWFVGKERAKEFAS
ncbi:MAG TPA: efflux RND transporter permease subunit [Pseudobdellovibrionaceae bacterium]|nr:efflux RND transporter permease subunit [Pseudobdellovibrionaceae bacterium]